jgi:hypothetical protein
MDYTKILKRAWQTTWRFKALWIFGFLYSLFGGGGGTGGGGARGMQYRVEDWPRLAPAASLGLVLAIGLFVVVLVVLAVVLRYLSQGALIGMVDEAEEKGETSVASGWLIGLANLVRLFAIDLTIGVPAVIVTLVLLGIGLSPLILLAARREALAILAVIATVALMFAVIAVLILMGVALSVIGELSHRQRVLEGKGVLDSIRDGYQLGRDNLRHVVIIWALLLGVSLLFGVIVVPTATVIFGLAAAPAAALYAATESPLASLLLGLVFAVPGILLLSALGGVYEAFRSAVWTLAYREL